MAERHHTGAPARRTWLMIVVILAMSLFAGFTAGCSSDHQSTPTAAASMDSIPGAPPMPDWLKTANSLTKNEYVWAASHLNELQYIPCYCGCGANGHTDNFACYYRRDAAGKITGYDQMSLG